MHNVPWAIAIDYFDLIFLKNTNSGGSFAFFLLYTGIDCKVSGS